MLKVGKETTATVTVLDQFGLVQVAYGVGKLRVNSEELLARRERPPETIEQKDEDTGKKHILRRTLPCGCGRTVFDALPLAADV